MAILNIIMFWLKDSILTKSWTFGHDNLKKKENLSGQLNRSVSGIFFVFNDFFESPDVRAYASLNCIRKKMIFISIDFEEMSYNICYGNMPPMHPCQYTTQFCSRVL